MTTANRARLFLNGKYAGTVDVHGWHGAWGFGSFTPSRNFSEFEALYARWANLMHRTADRLTPRLAAELRKAEYALYQIRGMLQVPHHEQCRPLAIVNIDGGSIEWKEGGPALVECPEKRLLDSGIVA